MDNEGHSAFEKNLVFFLRLFNNRPSHLAKYLIENNALDSDFIEKITNSKKISDIHDKFGIGDIPNIYFLNFKEMIRFFDAISKEYDMNDSDTNKLEQELNIKLDDLLTKEKYEEAIKIRDFMLKNNIRRNSQL